MIDDLFEIRPITENDMADVLEVYQQCEDFLALGSEPIASMKMVLQDIETSRQDKGVFSGIYAFNENLIGVIDYTQSDYSGFPHVAFISLLMIAAPYRNRGIGTKVLDIVESEIRMIDRVLEIQTAVQVNNPEALRFWQRNGYCVFGSPERRPDQTEVSYLRKNLFSTN